MAMRIGVLVLASVGCASQPASKPAPTTPTQPAPATAAVTQQGEAMPASAGQMVAPSILETRRVKGSILIVPDDMDKWKMAERRLTRIMHSSKLCIDVEGHIASVTMLRASGLPSYDKMIHDRIKEWEYSPFEINGKPAPVCTAVTIIYNQPLP
jgi:hypothetical protein